MELLLASLALVFGISDLIGEARTRLVERKLARLAKSSSRELVEAGQRLMTSLNFIGFVISICAVSTPAAFVQSRLAFTSDNESPEIGWFAVLIFVFVVPWAVLQICEMSFEIMKSSLPRYSQALRGQPERVIAVLALRYMHRSVRYWKRIRQDVADGKTVEPYGIDFPFYLGLTLPPLIFLSLIILLILRLLAACLLFGLWLLVGVPVMGLHSLALRLGKPSYFNLGKYVILVLVFATLLLGEAQ